MRLSCITWLLVALAQACTLTHSLDDLRGGVATGGGAGSSGATAGGASSAGGAAGDGNTAGEDVSAGMSGGGGVPESGAGPRLLATNFSEQRGTQGFLEPIELQFDDEIDPATLVGDALCKGSLQLVKTGEQLCVALGLAEAVRDAGGDVVAGRYRLQPEQPLDVGATYELIVTTAVRSLNGEPLAAETRLEAVSVYRHSVTIDGTNDFLAGEKLATTTLGYTAYVAWDRSSLYLGMTGNQIRQDESAVFLLAYLGWPGVEPRTKVGQTYKAVTPQLSFDATHYARWQGNNQGASITRYSTGTTWTEASLDTVGGARNRKDDFVELKVPFEAFGMNAPTANQVVPFAMFLLRETSGSELAFAAAPMVADGTTTAPHLSKHYDFSLTDSKMFPNQYVIR